MTGGESETIDALRAILAGWVTGAAIGVVSLGAIMILLARESDPMGRFPMIRVSLPVFGIVMANVLVIGWTLVGILLGFLYTLLSPGAYIVGVIALGSFVWAAHFVLRGSTAGETKFVWPSLVIATVLFASMVPVLVEVA